MTGVMTAPLKHDLHTLFQKLDIKNVLYMKSDQIHPDNRQVRVGCEAPEDSEVVSLSFRSMSQKQREDSIYANPKRSSRLHGSVLEAPFD